MGKSNTCDRRYILDGGLLYLPRLFVYHASAALNSDLDQTLQIMERRLYRFIMTPAMLLSWGFGLWLIIEFIGWNGGWLHAKLSLVMLLTICHFYLGYLQRSFAAQKNTHTPRFFRILNEIPTIFMVGIVIFVIVKPF